MQRQVTRDNHYVPQWYQRGFHRKGQHKLYILDFEPGFKLLPNGERLQKASVEFLGPKLAFQEFDLYTTRFGEILNDDIETYLFGRIDKRGADAVRAWSSGAASKIHHSFTDFFEYVDAQKLRTPKGLDSILKHYQGLPQTALMEQMQLLRQMHCTMWAEGVREIVSAKRSQVKFLVSDHPVTIYNPRLPPDSPECKYPADPGIERVGSQTIFPLDANHCLIITNLEYAQDPANASLLSTRTNARFRGGSLVKTDALIQGRHLTDADVHAVNLVLKSRARKYVGASDESWLYPERYCDLAWDEIAKVLIPRQELWRFGGDMFIGYADGTTMYCDPFGRTSRTHKFLAKPPLEVEPAENELCGCGSGVFFGQCCFGRSEHERPAWDVLSIRERNLVLLRGIDDILHLSDQPTSWLTMRRSLTDRQVHDVHELFAHLWPTDTQINTLLPRPQTKRLRALYLGIVDARTLSVITGMLSYFDEVVLVNPFINANGIRPEYSPIKSPAKYHEQMLRCVFVLKVLEPAIRAGRVHLIPDPLDYDLNFREEIRAIVEKDNSSFVLGPLDKARSETMGRDEAERALKRRSPTALRAYLKRRLPEETAQLTDQEIDSVIRLWKSELEDDPLAALKEPGDGTKDGEMYVLKGFCRETALYIAALTGSIVYTDSDSQWDRLHQSDGVHLFETSPTLETTLADLSRVPVQLPGDVHYHQDDPLGAEDLRAQLLNVARALKAGGPLTIVPVITNKNELPHPQVDGAFKLRPSVPTNGFQRTDVARLVMTFGRITDAAPVQLALFLEPSECSSAPRPHPRNASNS